MDEGEDRELESEDEDEDLVYNTRTWMRRRTEMIERERNILFTPLFRCSRVEVEMNSDEECNVGRSQPVSELVSVPAPRELQHTSVETRAFLRRQSRRNDQLHHTSLARTGMSKFRRQTGNKNPSGSSSPTGNGNNS